MSLEIERRFLVKGEGWKEMAGEEQHLRQGYLVASMQNWTVRVRILREEKAWLTLKSKAGEISQHEFEYLIPVRDAESLWKLAPYKLTKSRYQLNLQGGDWIVDCFKDKNAPLLIAEVELASEQKQIKPPSWCDEEVTKNKLLSNAALAQKPISDWSMENLLSINLG